MSEARRVLRRCFADDCLQRPRINVIGTCGCGKTTLARTLAARLGVTHIELDSLKHGPNWTETPNDLFRARLSEALQRDAWVVDGNYGLARDVIWSRANLVVWLDYSFPVVMGRLAWRTTRRVALNETLWHGNRESLRMTLLSRDSILLWGLRTYHRRKRQYPVLFKQPEHSHLTVVRLPTPECARQWLATFAPSEQEMSAPQ